MHKRTPEMVANLALGLKYFLDFAEAIGAVTKEQKDDLWRQGWEALGHAAAKQVLAIIGKRIFLDFRRPATGHANLVSGVGSAEMDRSSG